MPDFKLNQKGISLVEILLVILIVGLIIIVLSNLPLSLSLVGGSKHESLAKQIVQREIEQLRAQTYDNLANTSTPPPAIPDSRIGQLPAGVGIYIIADCAVCTSNELIKQVTARVSWIESGKSMNAEVSTFIAKGGL